MIAGPNGSGKSTVAPALLRDELQVTEFVNADAIAQGLSAFAPDKVAFDAGRIMLKRLHELAAARADFAFETTLASRTFAPWLRRLVDSGYQFHLVFVWLPSPDTNVERVALRVRRGGHNVPEDTIRRRYEGGLRNLFQLYRPLSATWRFYHNVDPSDPTLVARGSGEAVEKSFDPPLWEQIERQYKV